LILNGDLSLNNNQMEAEQNPPGQNPPGQKPPIMK